MMRYTPQGQRPDWPMMPLEMLDEQSRCREHGVSTRLYCTVLWTLTREDGVVLHVDQETAFMQRLQGDASAAVAQAEATLKKLRR